MDDDDDEQPVAECENDEECRRKGKSDVDDVDDVDDLPLSH